MTRSSSSRLASYIENRRVRLVIFLGLYGGALGASSLHVSFLARTRFPIEPDHLKFAPSVFLSSGGWIMGAIFRAPAFAVTQGTSDLFTGLLAEALFGVGGWVIDVANTSPYPRVSSYAPYVLSSSHSAWVVAVAAFAPADALAKLG